MDTQSLIFAVAALCGALLRAWWTSDQDFLSKRTINDAITGAVVGLLWSLWPPIEFPDSATLVQRAGIVFATAYFLGDAVQGFITRFNNRKPPLKG